MKTTHTILLLGLLLCGCSKKPAVTFIEAGKNVAWSDGKYTHVMHIAKRDGVSLEGIRVSDTDPYGQVTTITADKGTLDTNWVSIMSYGIEQTNAVFIHLHDAQLQNATTNQSIKEYAFCFHR